MGWPSTVTEVGRACNLETLRRHVASGKPIAERGKYVEIWREQADGGWKCIVDIFNSDLPEAPPPTR
jgi:ketosteroid isomerase-like protein